jgi:hypothetical protein
VGGAGSAAPHVNRVRWAPSVFEDNWPGRGTTGPDRPIATGPPVFTRSRPRFRGHGQHPRIDKGPRTRGEDNWPRLSFRTSRVYRPTGPYLSSPDDFRLIRRQANVQANWPDLLQGRSPGRPDWFWRRRRTTGPVTLPPSPGPPRSPPTAH